MLLMDNFLKRLYQKTEFYLILIIIILCVLLSINTDTFFTTRNAFDFLRTYSVTAIFAAGLFLVLASGGVDISFLSIASVVQYITMKIIILYGGDWLVAFILSGIIGILIGFLNAILIYFLKTISILITIANMNVFFALLMFFTKGRSMYSLPDWFSKGITLISLKDKNGDVYNLTLPIMAMIIVYVFTYILANKTSLGRQLFALGGNPEAAKRVGFNILALHLFAYGYMGFLAGIGGIIQAHRVDEVVPNALYGGELDVLAAVVLGGASLLGGGGSVIGTLLGVLLIAIVKNGMALLGISSYAFKIVLGLIIVLSVSAHAISDNMKKRKIKNF